MRGCFGSGELSGNIAILSGDLRKNKNREARKKGKERYELLLSTIDHLYIGLEPLVSKPMHKFTNAIINFRKLFPTFLFAKRWVHSCIFLATKLLNEKNYDGILVEYGAYTKDCDDYEHEVFFVWENGLRYTEMTLEQFKRRMNRLNQGTNNIPYIKCNVNSINHFHHLIEKSIFGEKYSDNPTKIYYNILSNEKVKEEYLKKYCGRNYDLISFNCQCFVAKMIEASYATIAPTILYTIEKGKINYIFTRIDYEDLKFKVPPNIVEELQKNENLIEQRKKEGKSRIVENNIKKFYNLNNFMEAMDEMGVNLGLKKENEWNKKTKEEKDETFKRMEQRISKLFDSDKI